MFCHSLPKVALVKSISLVKTKKINLMNMVGGCGWKNVVCFDLGFHTSNPEIKYRPDASCMSYMEAHAEAP